jgi:hypothetical protein
LKVQYEYNTDLLMPMYLKLEWWNPFLMVGFLAAVRIGVWLVARMFHFDD